MEDIHTIFNAPDHPTTAAYLAKYARTAFKLSAWMEESLPEGFTVSSFPKEHWRRLRTTNGLEPISLEIKCRMRVVRIFPNEAVRLQLARAILMEVSEACEIGKVYLTMEDDWKSRNLERTPMYLPKECCTIRFLYQSNARENS